VTKPAGARNVAYGFLAQSLLLAFDAGTRNAVLLKKGRAMKLSLPVLLVASAVVLSSCATMTPQEQAAFSQQMVATTPTCAGTQQCEAVWASARNWVINNCAMRIQTITDSFIQTYNSTPDSPDIACQVTKDPRPDGSYVLNIAVSCDNIFGCVPKASDAELAFNRVVSAAGTRFGAVPPSQATPMKFGASFMPTQHGRGVLVIFVAPSLPAAKAGIVQGNVILSFDGIVTNTPSALQNAVAALKAGQPASVVVVQNGKTATLSVSM
jgi:hypothetical protein